MVLSIFSFSVVMVAVHLNNFNDVLGDSHGVARALSSFEQQHIAFRTYANHRYGELGERYHQLRMQAAEDIADLRFDYNTMGLNRFLLTQAIRNAFEVYVQMCDFTVSLDRQSEEYIIEYYISLRSAEYISGFFIDLMRHTIDEGIEIYYQRVAQFRMLPVTAAIMVVIICVLIFTLTSLREKNELEARLHMEELQRLETEQVLKNMRISILQNQIHPHFLFNTLSTIRCTAKIEEARTTEDLIHRLANLLRYNLQLSDIRNSLTRELNILRDYMFIQHKRFGVRLNFSIYCTLDTDKIIIPTFLLQPIVENAVIHGISPKEEGGSINVYINHNRGLLIIIVDDNGVGISPDRISEILNNKDSQRGDTSGIGIGNVRDRAELLCPGSSLTINSHIGEGTTVRLEIPLKI